MANITQSSLEGNYDVTDANSYTTASITPSSNNLVLAWVVNYMGGQEGPTPTLSGNGLTWVLVDARRGSTINYKLSLFRAMGASPSLGAVTIDFGGNTQAMSAWSIMEFDNIDTSGTNGSGAIVQSVDAVTSGATSLTVTLASFSDVLNATAGGFLRATIFPLEGITQGSGFTEVFDTSGTSGLSPTDIQTEWRDDNDTSVDITGWSTSKLAIGIAVEIKNATQTVTGTGWQSPNGWF